MTNPEKSAIIEEITQAELIADPSVPHGLLDTSQVRALAVSGIKAMGARAVVSLLLSALSSLVLARLLDKYDYGVFGVAATIAGLGLYLGDVGLGAALVMNEKEPDDDETTTVFWAQQCLITTFVVGLLVVLPFLRALYKLTPASSGILIVMTLGLYCSSLRGIPIIVLDRRLRFNDIARCESIEAVVTTFVTISMALLKYGPWSFVGGSLAGRIVGLYCILRTSPWRPRGRFRWHILKRLFSVGLTMQIGALLPTLFGSWMPLVVSRYLGPASLGLVNWAGNLAATPGRLSGVLNRVAFPSFSRLQGSDNGEMGRAMVATTRRIGVAFGFAIPPFAIASPILIPLVFSSKWNAAVPIFQWLIMEFTLGTCVGLLASGQGPAGRAKDRNIILIIVGTLRWGTGYLAVAHYGLPVVAPLVYGATLLELLATAWAIRRYVKGTQHIYVDVIVPMLMFSLATATAITLAHFLIPFMLLTQAAAGLGIYFMCVGCYNLFDRRQTVTSELRGLIRMFRGIAPQA